MLCGCIYGVPPNVHDMELENLDDSRIDSVVLTKRVVLERGTKIIAKYSSETTVDEISTSHFGTEHEIANVDCIVAGLRSALKDPTIISPVEFWEIVGAGKDTINLTSLFDESYSYVANVLNLDYVIAAYHQIFDMRSGFYEAFLFGFIGDTNKSIAATITVDMMNKRVIDAIEVDFEHFSLVGHTGVVIPFALISYPEENPCLMAGRHAAEAISRSVADNKSPRIAVLVSAENPYQKIKQPE